MGILLQLISAYVQVKLLTLCSWVACYKLLQIASGQVMTSYSCITCYKLLQAIIKSDIVDRKFLEKDCLIRGKVCCQGNNVIPDSFQSFHSMHKIYLPSWPVNKIHELFR